MPKVTRREVGVWYEHFWTQCCPSVPCLSGGRVHAHFWPLRYQAPGPVASSGRALDGFEIVRQTGQAQRGRAPPQGLMLGNRRRGGTVKRHTLATANAAESMQRPAGFADLVAKVKPAVISVRVKVDAGAEMMGFDPGAPI